VIKSIIIMLIIFMCAYAAESVLDIIQIGVKLKQTETAAMLATPSDEAVIMHEVMKKADGIISIVRTILYSIVGLSVYLLFFKRKEIKHIDNVNGKEKEENL